MKCPDCRIGDISAFQLEMEGKIFIKCSGCGDQENEIEKILLYNYKLEQAEFMGSMAAMHGKERQDNPFKDEALEEWWDCGFHNYIYRKTLRQQQYQLNSQLPPP